MKVSYFIEYLMIGALYLIPVFIINYTYNCYKLVEKSGFIDSIRLTYRRIPDSFKGNVSLEIKHQNIRVFLMLFFLILVGAITNGILIHLDDFWIKFLGLFIPNSYNANMSNHVYMDEVKAIAIYNFSDIGNLLGKIKFQIIIARHGIFHSLVNFISLLFILSCNKLNLQAKIIWVAIVFAAFFSAANGFLAAKGWYGGVISCILSLT